MTDSGPRVLVVDDEPAIRRFLRTSLDAHGYGVFEAMNGKEALSAAATHRPDLIILDLGLPDMDGIEVTRLLREWTQIPIIIVTVQEQERAKIAALDAGADDYVTKPFNPRELVARVRAVLRRAGGAQAEPEPALLTVGPLELDLKRRSLRVAGRPVELTKTEFSILETLMANPGFTLGREELLEKALGYSYEGMGRTLDSHVRNLRRKIEADPESPRLIETMYGVGYRLNAGGRP